ncbi:hypothetical protein FACS1894130_04910 [Spirochaetia bacterium]|nr:hypothetical protein FACS1894110_14540 [Spirochaetia bacterium]GHT78403.1 hypothetical protein FACS1894130_04910 [Spirochaetia bacterium]
METIANSYVFNGEDISFIVMLQIEQTLMLIAQKENRSFDEVYGEFLESNTYRAIQDTRSLMWYENAEFIADEYYREKEGGN